MSTASPVSSAPYNRENAVVKAVRKVSPAVVNISSEFAVRKRRNPFSGFGMDEFFDSFFRDFFDPNLERETKRTSLGSGVIIDGKRGLIITNAHVITNAGIIKVVLRDEREYEAQIVGADPEFDLAVLRIQTDDPLPTITMGDSEDLMIGETVIAIGNPFGFSHTVTTGVISAINRSIRTEDRVYHEFIQIDASINPGNSGGPLLDINGELIGINTAIYAKAQGIGFAIPISKAKKIISDLIEYGEVIQAWIGITVQNVDSSLANYLKVPGKKGILVKAVETRSPAQKAGIQGGDIILSIGNRKIRSKDDYQTAMRGFASGDTLNVRIWRNNRLLTVTVTTKIFPMELADELAEKLLGVKAENLTSQNRHRYGVTARKGVVITDIYPRSYLFRIGARPGDVIRQIDELNILNIEDFKQAVVKYRHKKTVIILLQRSDQGYYITVELG
ncbi:MAG: Do family serine endopeptidase [Deltaproteobacteria bacterium]|nr:MAG: Do family serine endopeptidase [Deltaproteobacteria bacterium]